MPASLDLAREYGNDLHVLFVESQGASPEKAEAFAYRRKWMDTGAMWTTERPFAVPGQALPKFALLDCDGRLLLQGNPLAMKKDIETAISREIARSKEPPEGTPRELGKAWKAFEKGDVAGALAACDAVAASSPALAEPAESLRRLVLERAGSELARAEWLLDNGYPEGGIELLEDLSRALQGVAELSERLASQRARLAQPDATLQAELEAGKTLSGIEKKIAKGRLFDDSTVRALQKLAEKHPGTAVARRAAHLASLAAEE